MMKSVFWYLCFVVLATSCYNVAKQEKPENLISKDKMVHVIVDMSLFSSAKGINKKAIEKKGINPENYIYEKHEIDSTQFAESNLYYTYSIEDYESIYNRVKDSLENLKNKYSKIEKRQKEDKRKRDSIKRATRKDSFSKIKNKIKPKANKVFGQKQN